MTNEYNPRQSLACLRSHTAKLVALLMVTLLTAFSVSSAGAEGDLTRQEPIEVIVELGASGSDAHFFSPNHLEFETGKLYRLVLVNNSATKHYFTSYTFARMVFTRKVQTLEPYDGGFRRTAEIKGDITEIEVFPGNRAEWWFVPIQTGEITDLHCHVSDDENGMTHEDMGMVGTITIR